MAYSVMKIMANFLALNSVLNPETNSLSPSAKSKGVRLVSAKIMMSHITNKLGKMIKIEWFVLSINCLGEMKNNLTIKEIITKIKLISSRNGLCDSSYSSNCGDTYLFALHPVNITG